MILISQFTDKQNRIVSNLLTQLRQVDSVEAIALGGSYASGKATVTSDIDIGLYYHDDAPFAIDDIRDIADAVNDEPNPTVTDFGDWGKWVNGGGWLTIEGQRVDFLYRSLNTLQYWIEQSHNGIIELDYYQQPVTGFYSYMYLAELAICVPLRDEHQHIVQIKSQIATYPPKLKDKIIREFSWMADFTLYHAEVAIQRGDVYGAVGCIHRVIACIVQIIYAKNERYFLSDKGTIAECAKMPIIVNDFEPFVADILTHPTKDNLEHLKELLSEIISL
ncbi:MAG: nucleotidyltransferase domain-containing protein [Chloroflexota bacterium]